MKRRDQAWEVRQLLFGPDQAPETANYRHGFLRLESLLQKPNSPLRWTFAPVLGTKVGAAIDPRTRVSPETPCAEESDNITWTDAAGAPGPGNRLYGPQRPVTRSEPRDYSQSGQRTAQAPQDPPPRVIGASAEGGSGDRPAGPDPRCISTG